MSSFWLILKQQWTIEDISIFSNSSHLEWRAGLSDTILKGTHPGNIPARFGLIWFSGFIGKDLNVIFYQNMPNLHNWYKAEAIMAPGTILDNRSEQKVTTIDQNLVRNISAKNGSNPSSGSWEEVCFTYFHRVAMLNYVLRWWPSWIFNRSKK